MNFCSLWRWPIYAGVAFLCLISGPTWGAVYYFVTDQQGAQTQIDVNHTSLWVVTPANDVDIYGGLFQMKDGSQTSDDVVFSIYAGNLNLVQIATATALASKVLTNSAFDQQVSNGQNWDLHSLDVVTPPSFFTLLGGTTYTAVLTSVAPDNQNRAYFIKGGAAGFADSSNTSVFINPASIPEPSAAWLLLVGLGAWAIVRSRKSAV